MSYNPRTVKIEDLDFSYPERLIATERAPTSRVMLVTPPTQTQAPETQAPETQELTLDQLLNHLNPGDTLVINDTRVLKRRVFTQENLEILFLKPTNAERTKWSVLCPSSRWKPKTQQTLKDGTKLDLIERGRTQTLAADRALNEDFFEQHGEMPLPPYIQKARNERHNRANDKAEYQTHWAKTGGSLAAPTASLHFTQSQLAELRTRGIKTKTLTLHVGLGTFLPITAATLEEHTMHAEAVDIPAETWQAVDATIREGHRVWALGTTVARSLESAAHGKLDGSPEEGFVGETDLFITPGFEWKIVRGLLTNFHQPRSTLVALVASFAGLETTRKAYQWAIEREFRLFSYGDLTAWIR